MPFCCCPRSLTCWADTVLHLLHLTNRRICDRHDRNITQPWEPEVR